MPQPKVCADCKHSYRLKNARDRRCIKSDAPNTAEGSLCGEMRQGDCGADARFYEPR